MRQSKDWQAACRRPKSKERTALFKATMLRFGFSSASIQKHAEACRDACWIGQHLGSHDTQTTSLRAFKAVQMHAFGKRGRPRFKGKTRLHSVEGKGDAVIRLRWQDEKPVVLWDGLVLPLLRDPRDRDSPGFSHGEVQDLLSEGRLEPVLPDYAPPPVSLNMLIVPEQAGIARVRLLVGFLAGDVLSIPGIDRGPVEARRSDPGGDPPT
ncbi:MAG TPA: hypothetical protein VD860_16780 [Azospirillum sp.]|nr:hypothetical protein [Azospirillum sp.]